jgi:hypothetical protein
VRKARRVTKANEREHTKTHAHTSLLVELVSIRKDKRRTEQNRIVLLCDSIKKEYLINMIVAWHHITRHCVSGRSLGLRPVSSD